MCKFIMFFLHWWGSLSRWRASRSVSTSIRGRTSSAMNRWSTAMILGSSYRRPISSFWWSTASVCMPSWGIWSSIVSRRTWRSARQMWTSPWKSSIVTSSRWSWSVASSYRRGWSTSGWSRWTSPFFCRRPAFCRSRRSRRWWCWRRSGVVSVILSF